MGNACCSDASYQAAYVPSQKKFGRKKQQSATEEGYDRTSWPPPHDRQSATSNGASLNPKLSFAASAAERKLGYFEPSRPLQERGTPNPPTLVGEDGSIYVGQMKEGKPLGIGKLYLPDGGYFSGTFREMPEGEGRFITEAGVYYEGEVSKGMACGKGKTVNHHKGYSYQGDWDSDMPEGEGLQIWEGISEYEGHFRKGIKQGKGTYKRMAQFQYRGNFRDGQFNGEGTIELSNQDSYKGQWRQGLFHGIGVYKWADGSSYEGQFREGFKDGWGKYKSKDGQVFEGLWQRGKREGKGRLSKDGKSVEGVWSQDKFSGIS